MVDKDLVAKAELALNLKQEAAAGELQPPSGSELCGNDCQILSEVRFPVLLGTTDQCLL